MTKRRWILLLMQLPTSASTARVSIWRRLRAAGATSVEHGAWMLPLEASHQSLFTDMAETIDTAGGSAAIFEADAVGGDDAMIARFADDRAREYHEFTTRSQGLLDEIAKEKAAEKFTFAELEEIEDDLKKLETWLGKIAARDFFAGDKLIVARQTLESCAVAVRCFAARVYEAGGVSEPPGVSQGD